MDTSFWSRANGDRATDRKVLRTVAILLLTLVSLWLIYQLRKPIFWLVMAAFLAVAAAGPVDFLARKMRRGAAIAIVYTGILLAPFAIGAVLLPPLVNSAVDLVKDLPDDVREFQKDLEHNDLYEKVDRNFNINERLTDAAEDLAGNLGSAAGTLGDIGGMVINSVFAGFTILILSMFMVARGGGWVQSWIRRRPPHEAEALERTVRRVASAVGGYIGGALLQAFVAFIFALIVLTIIGAPSPLVLAAIVGAFDVIPMVGSSIAGVVVGVVMLFGDLPLDLIVWVVFVVAYQQFENYVIQPQIQKRAVELDPFIVLVAVIFGGTLMGIFGAVFAIPVAATIQIVTQEFRVFRHQLAALDTGETSTPL